LHGGWPDRISARQGSKPPMSECHDNIRSVAMVAAALEPGRTGGGFGPSGDHVGQEGSE
jgi:hypothetical protein